MKKLIIAIILVSGLSIVGKAQDIHFSQFFNAPLNFNPALTGKLPGKFRVGAIYRDQWRSIDVPYSTISGFVDVPIRLGSQKQDVVGVGLNVFHDKTGTVGLTTLSVGISGSYHKSLGIDNTHKLGIGVQLGIYQKRIDASDAIFEDQIDGSLSVGQASQDVLNLENVLVEDFNVGLVYSARLGKESAVTIGGALFHITQPNQSLLGGESSLPMRYTAHLNFDLQVSKKISLMPSGIFLFQAKTNEINVGLGMNYSVAESVDLLLGAYYRIGDAVIPTFGVDFKGYRLGVSYDLNVSDLGEVTNNRGAYEISFIYQGRREDLPYQDSYYYSPEF